jgi:hypothetical protein
MGKIDYRHPMRTSDGLTGFGVEHVADRRPVRIRRGRVTVAALIMAGAVMVGVAACGPADKELSPEPGIAATDSSGNTLELTKDDDASEWSAPIKDWPKSAGVPRCEHEDGSTQSVCYWYDKANGVFVNMDYGRWTYVTTTGDMLEYGPNFNKNNGK